jgi:hypothetical protein
LRKLTLAMSAALSLSLAGSAGAATLIQTVSLLSPYFAVVTAGSTSFSKFDTTLGTLNSVNFEYSFPNGLTYINGGGDYMDYYLFSPNFTTQLLHGSNFGIPGGANLGSPHVVSTSDSSIAQYLGSGSLTLIANISKHNNSSWVAVNSGATARVIYNYTAAAPPVPVGVPEPSTWAMIILGFGGLGGVLRTRRRGAAAQA